MPDIASLPAATSFGATDLIPVTQGSTGPNTGTTRTITPAQLSTQPQTTQTSSYTFALTDAGTLVEFNSSSAGTFTIPTNASVALPLYSSIGFRQYGTGQLTLAGASGVTLRTASSLTTRAQYSEGRVHQRAANEWVVSGDMT